MVKCKMHKNRDPLPTNHVQYSNHFRSTSCGFGDLFFCGVGAYMFDFISFIIPTSEQMKTALINEN